MRAILTAFVLTQIGPLEVSARIVFAAAPGSPSLRGGSGTGTFEDPLASVQACLDALTKPGDECRLRAGRYPLSSPPYNLTLRHGSAEAPLVLGSAGDGDVIFDGTVEIEKPWHRVLLPSGAVGFRARTSHEITQLFDADRELQVYARWPNAFFYDKSVFLGPERWAHSANGTHDVKSGVGELTDAGPCASPSDCCSACNANGLAASGVNATGALAILNLWSCDTAIQPIASHEPGTGRLHYNATWVNFCDKYRGGFGLYYLEGKLDLLDAPTEWYYENETKSVFWIPRNASIQPSVVYARTSDQWALNIKGSTHVVVANISFFACALAANDTNGVPSTNLKFESLRFNYSTASRRAVGDVSPPDGMTVWTNVKNKSGVETHLGTDGTSLVNSAAVDTHIQYNDVWWMYSNGNVLFHRGGNVTLNNCVVEWNDWTTVGGCKPGWYSGSSTLCIDGQTQGARISRLTMQSNGRSAGLRPGGETPPAQLELIHFSRQFEIMGDGCFVEASGDPSPHITHCWSHDSGKSALRFDGQYEPPGTSSKGTAHGVMSFNVGWNVSALVVKGDYHNITNNTVFDGADIEASKAAHSLPRYQDADSSLCNASIASLAIGAGTTRFDPRADANTRVTSNIFDSVQVHRAQCPTPPCPPPGIYELNAVGLDVKKELRDPWNWDFRPCPNSSSAQLGAGAYKSAGEDDYYLIPGARRDVASTPVPKQAGSSVPVDTNLMFLEAYRAVTSTVFLGLDPSELVIVAEGLVAGQSNIVTIASPLQPNTRYYWRVDSRLQTGDVRQGNDWFFDTGQHTACGY